MSTRRAQFEQLVLRHADDLARYALWLCRDRALADDLVQETCLRAWRSVDRLRDPAAAKSWLITILRREYARSFERKVPELVDVQALSLADESAPVPADETEHELLRRAIAALDPKYREPLVLQVLLGFSCEEIAQLLGLTRSAVMTQLFRARQQLRSALEDGGADGGGEP